MALANRLDKVTASMSGRDRVLLVLQALNDGRAPDPQLHQIEDPTQARIYDRLVGLIHVVTTVIDSVCHQLAYQVDRLEDLKTYELLLEVAKLWQSQTGETVDPRVVKRWRKAKSVTAPEIFYGIAEEVRQTMLADVLARCAEMAALDVVSQELIDEFGGEDPRAPDLQEEVNETWTKLRAQLIRLNGPRRLPGPNQEAVDFLRDKIESAFASLRVQAVAR